MNQTHRSYITRVKNASLTAALVLITVIGSFSQAQLIQSDTDGEKMHTAQLVQLKRMQRQDDARLSAFLRLWMYYLNDPQYIEAAQLALNKGSAIASVLKTRATCGLNPTNACLRYIGCKINPAPYASECPQSFRVYGNGPANVYLNNYANGITLNQRAFTAMDSPYLIEADDIVYYGIPNPDDERPSYLVAASLLAQSWLANSATHDSNWSEYYGSQFYSEPKIFESPKKVSFEKFVLVKARKLVEAKFREDHPELKTEFSLVNNRENYENRINDYLRDRESGLGGRVTTTFSNYKGAQKLDLSHGFPIQNREVDFELNSVKLNLPFTFNCADQNVVGLFANTAECRTTYLPLTSSKADLVKPKDLELGIRAQNMVRDSNGVYFSPYVQGRVIGESIAVAAILAFVPVESFAAAAANITRYVLKIAGLPFNSFVQLPAGVMTFGLVNSATGLVVQQVGQKAILTAAQFAFWPAIYLSFTHRHDDIVKAWGSSNGALKYSNGDAVIKASENFQDAVKSADPEKVKLSYNQFNSALVNFMSQGNESDRNPGIRVYSKDRYQ